MLLDYSVGVNMAANSRSDGTMIIMGAAGMLLTTVLPRVSDYALCYMLHTTCGVVALNFGPVGDAKASRSTNFVGFMFVALAISYTGERRRRENQLLSWRLLRSQEAAAVAGTSYDSVHSLHGASG